MLHFAKYSATTRAGLLKPRLVFVVLLYRLSCFRTGFYGSLSSKNYASSIVPSSLWCFDLYGAVMLWLYGSMVP